MGRSKETSKAIDVVLKLLVSGALTGTILFAPNAVQALDKPLKKFFDKLDDREKQRKLSKMRTYMLSQHLVTGSYEHGLVVTEKATKRLKKNGLEVAQIPKPRVWDKKWRLVFFDIPEFRRHSRLSLVRKLRVLGYQPLQQSVWIHPFPSRNEITKVCVALEITTWVTYIETAFIDSSEKLELRFKRLL